MLKWLFCFIVGHRWVIRDFKSETRDMIYYTYKIAPFCSRCGKINPNTNKAVR